MLARPAVEFVAYANEEAHANAVATRKSLSQSPHCTGRLTFAVRQVTKRARNSSEGKVEYCSCRNKRTVITTICKASERAFTSEAQTIGAEHSDSICAGTAKDNIDQAHRAGENKTRAQVSNHVRQR